MANYSKTIIVGKATRDAELNVSDKGVYTIKFAVAVNRGKDKPADFFDVVTWGETRAWIAEAVKKGGDVLVEGQMQANKYNDVTRWQLIADKVLTIGARPKAEAAETTDNLAEWEALGKSADVEY
jgi:single stranded DNA-binding protein